MHNFLYYIYKTIHDFLKLYTMKKAVSVVFVIYALLLSFSCAPVYVPNAIHTPLLTQQHDASLQGSFGFNGYDVQAAYSPVKGLGIMANAGFYDETRFSHTFFEGGVGYYGAFENTGRYEIYGGYGNGSTDLFKTDNSIRVTGHYNRIFLQPSIGAKTNVFEASFAPRFVYVNFYDLNIDNTIYNNVNSIYIEPVVTARVGYKYAKFFVQFGLSLHSDNLLSLYSSPFIFNMGLNLSFSKLYLNLNKD